MATAQVEFKTDSHNLQPMRLSQCHGRGGFLRVSARADAWLDQEMPA
jgi:hypothetical protein